MNFNILIKASHIQGRNNKVCDALFRFQQIQIRELAPEADWYPQPIPQFLWNICDLELENCFSLA